MRYVTCSRNFNDKISQKESFISLLGELKKKIISFLFDDLDLVEYEYEFIKNSESCFKDFDIKYLIEEINDYYKHKNEEQDEQKLNRETLQISSVNRKLSSDTFNQEDITYFYEEEMKTKINLTPLNEDNILLFLGKIINLLELAAPNEQDKNIQSLISFIISKASMISNQVTPPKHIHLRKHVCLKLHKTFSFIFKLTNIPDTEIKQLCLSIESILRNKDIEMASQYRMRIHSIFKAINN